MKSVMINPDIFTGEINGPLGYPAIFKEIKFNVVAEEVDDKGEILRCSVDVEHLRKQGYNVKESSGLATLLKKDCIPFKEVL